MTQGLDQNRVALLLAMLEKRGGMQLTGDDVFVNIAGGMTVDEPASDLAVLGAIASSVRNRPIAATTAVFGEVGLAGEVRAVARADARLKEAAKLGFGSAIVPPRRGTGAVAGPRLIEIGHVADLLALLRAPPAAAAGERRTGHA